MLPSLSPAESTIVSPKARSVLLGGPVGDVGIDFVTERSRVGFDEAARWHLHEIRIGIECIQIR